MTDPIIEFMGYLEARDATDMTITRYSQVISSFLDFAGVNPKDLTKEHVVQYKLHLRKLERGKNYQKFLFSVLRMYYIYLKKPWEFSKNELVRGEPFYRPWFKLEEVNKLLDVAKEKGPMVHALVRIAALTGPRRGELRGIRWNDYEFPLITIKTLKHGEITSRVIDYETNEALSKLKQTGRIFPISDVQVSTIFRNVKEEADIDKPKAGIHAFRRSLVTFLKLANVSDEEINRYFGWKRRSEIMVEVYSQLDPRELQKKIIKVHPLIPDDERDALMELL